MAGDVLEAFVRRLARIVDNRYDAPSIEDLREDDEFAEIVERLASSKVDADRVVKFCRESSPALSGAAIEAMRRRTDVPRAWWQWAVRQTGRASHTQTLLLLDALATSPQPVVVRVLAQADRDWEYDSLRQAVAAFVERRLARGETIDAARLEEQLKPAQEPFVTSLIPHFADGFPPAFASAVAAWRRSQLDVTFFQAFAEVLEPTERRAVLTGGRERAIETILDAVTAAPRRSVLLVGEHGVGKSTVAREAVSLLADEGWVAFVATAAGVHAGQVYVGELETRVSEIAERMDGRSLLWIFPNLEEGLWAGQHTRSPQGLLDGLLPHVAAGRIVMIGEVDPVAYELLVQERPRLVSAFTVVRLSPFAEADALELARTALAEAGLEASTDTLRESFELAEHYLPGVASPGGLLRVLDRAAARLPAGTNVVDTPAVLDGISASTGLPLRILDARVPLQLEELRASFERRVLGQPEAVDCLVERIALIKAGLTDPTRPLGVFLFVGPTGTGKTEIAKTLAEYVFGSADRLVRLDMSEFQTAESHERLLADSTVEEHAAPLISSVRRQPFSVVLLDEFEKAHSNIWSVFLQVFDDGRLTDRRGRTVDFRHCVFVLTSNIGSAIPGERIGFERGSPAFTPGSVEREVTRWFRPELLNRLDRVVVFRPLDRDVMRSLLRNELGAVLARRGFRTLPWAVEWDEAAIDFLLERGFTAELGARPLKRAVERYVLAPLALAIVERQFPEGDQFLFVGSNGREILVTFVDPDLDGDEAGSAPSTELRLGRLVSDPEGSRGEVALLRELREQLRARVEEWQARKEDALAEVREVGFWDRQDRAPVLSLIEYVDRVVAAWMTGERLQSRLDRGSGRPSPDGVRLLAQRVYLLERALDGLDAGRAADAFVRVAAQDGGDSARSFAGELAVMYESWAAARGMGAERIVAEPGLTVLAVSGLAAYTILQPETGLHVLEVPTGHRRAYDRVLARVAVAPRPFSRNGAEGAAAEAEAALASLRESSRIVRRYRREPSPLVRDAIRGWRTGRIDRVLSGDFDLF